ncbi:MAG: hypothetical protein ACLVHS_14905 [Blautia wexlerae]
MLRGIWGMVRRGSGYGKGKDSGRTCGSEGAGEENDVRIVLNSKGEEPDGYDVVLARSGRTEKNHRII